VPLPSFASTTACVAQSPSVTGIFTPDSVAPSKAVLIEDAVGAPGPSEEAKHPMTEPSATFGNTAPFWASEPASSTASAKK
jgi:hypothetical protein